MTTTTVIKTKKQRLVEALNRGQELTVAQIRSRFGLANPTALVSKLIFAGYNVQRNRFVDSRGRTKTRYSLVTSTRRAATRKAG